MKLFIFLPFALGSRIPTFLNKNDETGSCNSLCESHECPEIEGIISYGIETMDGISTTSCSKEYKNSFLSARMDRCEYYNADHIDCVDWAKRELNSACGDDHNCIETKFSSVSGWAPYWGYSSK